MRRQLIREAGQMEALRARAFGLFNRYPYGPAPEAIGFVSRLPSSEPRSGAMQPDDYDKCASDFQDWGTVISKLPTLAGQGGQPNVNPYDPANHIADQSTDKVINVLASVAEYMGRAARSRSPSEPLRMTTDARRPRCCRSRPGWRWTAPSRSDRRPGMPAHRRDSPSAEQEVRRRRRSCAWW